MDGAGEHPLFRRHSTKRNFSTMAASHRDPSENESSSSLFLPHDDHYDNDRPTRRRRVEVEGLALPRPGIRPARVPGDGLDYRRPVTSDVTSAAAAPVIDLTDDDNTESQDTEASASTSAAASGSSRAQRGPRFGRNIIDIAGSDNEEEMETSDPRLRLRGHSTLNSNHRPQYSSLRRPTRPPSPPAEINDIEFLAERPLSRPVSMSRGHTPAIPPAPRSITPYPAGFEPIDLTNDDDVVHLNTRPRDGINAARPGTTAGVGTRADRQYGHLGHIADILRGEGVGRLMQRFGQAAGLEDQLRAQHQALEHFQHTHRHHHHHHNRGGVDPRIRLGAGPARAVAMMPIGLDYGATGFDMGLHGGNRPPTPKYSPPPEPESGFTRNPKEDEVVVCPNCGDELAMGESEEKQKVWVVKGCGHVGLLTTKKAYCGECAEHRSRSVSKKGKGKATDSSLPPPFKKCVVEGCGKPTSKTAMIQVFLGS